ncbi:hypothetical protein L486_03499 [Kwoniella mangroviensis CBS 10435]|uniref:HSF-type DNA-binding domain-containing protein n=1 Tax=Kwoniella mangroviensis CBS 10435 TaxID=1331196 RepID=A0A1B9ITY4_9TREE|nr:hypothetical protein L486_03499 [Kwoniella mangroviensis CBS 10435]
MPEIQRQRYETSPDRMVSRYSAINGGSKPPNFLQKLYDFLSLEPHPCPDIIYWASDSKQLVIAQPDRLAKEVLPKLFKHDKIASFGRQLNIYGFSRLFPGRQFKDSQGNISDASVWAHPTLNRLSSPSELLSIKRRAPPKLIRTRRLANGEIIRTKAGPGVIEKARQIKEAMNISKNRERSSSSSLWNKQSQTQPQSRAHTDHGANTNTTDQSSMNIDHYGVKRNNTYYLSDIAEYSENGTTTTSISTNDDGLQNSVNTTTTNASGSIWPHVNLDGSSIQSPARETSSLHSQKPLPKPLLILGERPYSSCPASIHTSPTHRHTSLPFNSTYSPSQFNTLTSSINSTLNPGTGLGFGSGPGLLMKTYKPDLTIDTNAAANYGYTNSPLNINEAHDQLQLSQIQPSALMPNLPPRIAAPAAPIPPHLLQNRTKQTQSRTEGQDGILSPDSHNNVMSGYGFTPYINPHNNSSNFQLSSSWDKIQIPNSIYTGSKTCQPQLMVKPMIMGNGNGTIDPRWVSPVGSEWSTPSITRVSSPSNLSLSLSFNGGLGSRNDSIDTSSPIQPGLKEDKEEHGDAGLQNDEGKSIPPFIWYNPAHLSTLTSSLETNINHADLNKDHNHVNVIQGSTSTNFTDMTHSFDTHTNNNNRPFISSPLAPLMNPALPQVQDHHQNQSCSASGNSIKWFE